MPSESELRDIIRGEGEPDDRIDLARVIRRARARRRPRVLLAAGAGALALAGIVVPVTVALGSAPSGVLSVTSDESGGHDGTQETDASPELPPADSLNRCGEQVAHVVPAANGLVLEMSPVTADATADRIPVVVTLRNVGTDTVRGTTGGSPPLTLAEDGRVLWHSNGPTTMIAIEVDLDPGESLEYPAEFEPAVCSPEDDADGFRDDLPDAGPGVYALSAVIDFVPADGTAKILVTGSPVAVTLR